MKSILAILFVIIVACFNNSCATQFVWEKTDPATRVWIPADQMTQAELDRRGSPYTVVYNDKQLYGFLIEKSWLHKFGDYTVRTLTTPITVIVDGVTISVMLWAYLESPAH